MPTPRRFIAGPYTLESFSAAPPFTVFQGEAADPGEVPWAVFHIGGNDLADLDHASEAAGVDVDPMEPQVDIEANVLLPKDEQFDDHDAALAYLREGGALCKVPDAVGSPYYRLLCCDGVRGPRRFDAL